ncbi:uncharacterized protein LOC131956262 [Physella acuta]|uniref:uncharacterized protein LOC131956262 n=1 Tax=Physella acuta TaxID=109671 RepID=UPI0027DD5FF5|nr:uncharacterized protein LOC131956262 [Physella acuta]
MSPLSARIQTVSNYHDVPDKISCGKISAFDCFEKGIQLDIHGSANYREFEHQDIETDCKSTCFKSHRDDIHKIKSKQKSVKWSENLCEVSTVVNDEQYDSYKLLMSKVLDRSPFLKSPTFQAVVWGLGNSSNTDNCVSMAAVVLRVKLNRYPNTEELMDTFDNLTQPSADYFIKLFIDICLTATGAANLNSLLKELGLEEKTTQTKMSEGKKSEHMKPNETVTHTQGYKTEESDDNDDLLQTQKPVSVLSKPASALSKEQQFFQLRAEALKHEQTYLQKSLTCMLCNDRRVDTLLLPCGHVVLCSVCSETCYTCPLCKTKALGEVKTFLC